MEIQDRTFDFAVRVITFADKVAKTTAGQILVKQLVRSGTSIGANMEEADGATSKKDFINKVTIARKEARETNYWLRLVRKAGLTQTGEAKEELNELIQEADELKRILSAIVNKAKDNGEYK